MSKLTHHLLTLLLFLSSGSTVLAATLLPGDLIISEVLANPAAVSDSNGEWFEIFNPTANIINLNGLTISDDGSNSHIIESIETLSIAPGNYFVLGNNDDSNTNGGYPADYRYASFSLANSSDQIIIADNSTEIARLDYSGLPFGNAGISAELFMQALNPAQSSYQLTPQQSLYQFGLGDYGTPGSQGSIPLTVASPIPLPGSIWLFGSALLVGIRKMTVS